MKTAMQELIDLLELNTTNEPLPHLIDVIKEVYLEKEKEQLLNAFEIGYNEGCSYMYDNGNDLKNGEQYYNQTYNQNK